MANNANQYYNEESLSHEQKFRSRLLHFLRSANPHCIQLQLEDGFASVNQSRVCSEGNN